MLVLNYTAWGQETTVQDCYMECAQQVHTCNRWIEDQVKSYRNREQPSSEMCVGVTAVLVEDHKQVIHQLDLFLMGTWLKTDLTISRCTRIQIPDTKVKANELAVCNP